MDMFIPVHPMVPPLARANLGGQSNFLKLGYNFEKWFFVFWGKSCLEESSSRFQFQLENRDVFQAQSIL